MFCEGGVHTKKVCACIIMSLSLCVYMYASLCACMCVHTHAQVFVCGWAVVCHYLQPAWSIVLQLGTHTQSKTLEKVQKRAARWLTASLDKQWLKCANMPDIGTQATFEPPTHLVTSSARGGFVDGKIHPSIYQPQAQADVYSALSIFSVPNPFHIFLENV